MLYPFLGEALPNPIITKMLEQIETCTTALEHHGIGTSVGMNLTDIGELDKALETVCTGSKEPGIGGKPTRRNSALRTRSAVTTT